MKRKMLELIDTDINFCKDSQLNGSKGWEKYLSKDALMGTRLHEPYISKRSDIVNLIEMIYSLENIDFVWNPEHAFISDDSTLGVTTGTYTRKYKVGEEEFTEKGKYVTTWKKIGDKWKIVFDMGN